MSNNSDTIYSRLVDDRVDEGVFRIDRDIYLNEDVYEKEIDVFFEKGWVYLCHESQVKEAGDYFSTHIGRQPVFLLRQKDGSLSGFLNACAHRASMLVPLRQGRARTLTCRFHGWVFDSQGKCIKIKDENTGAYPENFACKEHFRLTRVAKVESYGGFVFGSLNENAPPLEAYLGAAKSFIDMFSQQSPDGMEIVAGSSTYVGHHNWKLQVENVVDGYHVTTVHRNFASTIMRRDERPGYDAMMKTDTGRMRGAVANGCYDLGHGHMAIWVDRADLEAAPLHASRDRIEGRVEPELANWMLRRGRNLMVFPNLVLNDLASTHLRVHRPLGPGLTEITIWCIAPVGEPREARIARVRKFEDFFLVSGMATSDDLVSMDVAHGGARARGARWNEFLRGMDSVVEGPDERATALG
ncbi:MAG: Rieske 2Fe-2S domain-containing protein, partial [Aquisalimonadaceae bacterium]